MSEDDETMVGGFEEGGIGRRAETGSMVVIAAEVRSNWRAGRKLSGQRASARAVPWRVL